MNKKKLERPVAWLFLIAGLFGAGIAYLKGTAMVEREASAHVDSRAYEAMHSVQQQISAYAEVLRGLETQFVANPNLSAETFRQVFHALQIESRLPGIQALGFSPKVSPEMRALYDANLQSQLMKATFSTSAPGLKPRVVTGDSYIVRHIEPFARNHLGFSVDQATSKERLEAIEQARDTGTLAVSGRVRLFVEPGNVDGIIFFLPLYRDGDRPVTLAERREKFFGVVFLAIRVDDMLRDVFGPQMLDDVRVEIYDNRRQGDARPGDSRNGFIFASRLERPALRTRTVSSNGQLATSKELPVGGREWKLSVTATSEFVRASQHWLPPTAAFAGVLLSLLAFSFMRSLEFQRRIAESRARQAKRTLDARESQLAEIMNSIDEVVWSFEIPGEKVRYVSPAVERIYGRPPASFYDAPHLWLECIHPEDQQRAIDLSKKIVTTGAESLHFRIIRPDGTVRWIRYTARYIENTDCGSARINSIGTDVTEQRSIEASLRHSNRAMRAIHACDKIIAVAESENTLLHGICDLVVSAGYRMAWVGLLGDEGSGNIIVAGAAGAHYGYLAKIRSHLEGAPRDAGTTIAEAVRTRRPAIVNDIEKDLRFAPWREDALQCGFHGKIALPLFHDDKTLGVLNVYAAEHDAFDQEEVDLLVGLAQSITVAIQAYRHKAAEQEAKATLHLYKQAIDACANAIVISSADAPDYPVEYVNPAFERITGYPAAEITQRSLRVLQREECDQPGLRDIRATLLEKREGRGVIRNYRKDGTPFWCDVYIAPVRDDDGEVHHFVSAMYDITDNKRYMAELEFHANHDTLTRLANRNLLRDRLTQALAAARRSKQPLWVMFIDLDRFKVVSDTLGHETADLILVEIANRLRNATRSTDTVARWGSDKFVLVLSTHEGENRVPHIVQRVMADVCAPYMVGGHELVMTCSIGIANYPNDGENAESLIKNADLAVHNAKDRGRNNFQFFAPTMNQRAMDRLRVEHDLRNALKGSEFVLFYQPQVDLLTGRVVGMEALVRWQHPARGMIPPGEFIWIAEDSGLIVPIGAWVLRTACAQAASWGRGGFSDFRVAVNLSARQFAEEGLVDLVAATLVETGLPAERLDIELTESMMMTDVEKAIDTLKSLKALGVQLSIDDFGTGYSSLSYLKRFPIDVLKIDRSFVSELTTDMNNAAIAEAIISMAHSLGIRVIAEGVESEAQCEFLSKNMCDEIQGYMFSAPLPAEKVEALFQEKRELPKHLLRLRKPATPYATAGRR